jgi:hypothetical protein
MSRSTVFPQTTSTARPEQASSAFLKRNITSGLQGTNRSDILSLSFGARPESEAITRRTQSPHDSPDSIANGTEAFGAFFFGAAAFADALFAGLLGAFFAVLGCPFAVAAFAAALSVAFFFAGFLGAVFAVFAAAFLVAFLVAFLAVFPAPCFVVFFVAISVPPVEGGT